MLMKNSAALFRTAERRRQISSVVDVRLFFKRPYQSINPAGPRRLRTNLTLREKRREAQLNMPLVVTMCGSVSWQKPRSGIT